jgi:hypothetical protein
LEIDQLEVLAKTLASSCIGVRRNIGWEADEHTFGKSNPSDTPARPTGKEARGESFMLLFHGPSDRMLPQGTYAFTHDELGRFDLFIVPIGQAPGVFQYQAVFNRAR